MWNSKENINLVSHEVIPSTVGLSSAGNWPAQEFANPPEWSHSSCYGVGLSSSLRLLDHTLVYQTKEHKNNADFCSPIRKILPSTVDIKAQESRNNDGI